MQTATLFALPEKCAHPAKYSVEIRALLMKILRNHRRILDPFAGVGGIHRLWLAGETYGIEIEPEWAVMHSRTQVGNALYLPWPDEHFDAICTSPTYGNRMADHHEARDSSRRNTYRHVLGRKLHSDNSGQLQWSDDYREFHVRAWREATRVLQPGGLFVLNISDHIRNWRQAPVSDWHIETLISMGFVLRAKHEVRTQRQRYGANASARAACEYVIEMVR
jgi:tRNA G10  N-methylase Trm11